MSSVQYFIILILCAIWVSDSFSKITLKSLENHHVVISSPDKVHALLTAQDSVSIVWDLPLVYVPRDVSAIEFEKLKRGTKVDVKELNIDHVAVKDANNETVSGSDAKSGRNGTTPQPDTKNDDKDRSTDDKDRSTDDKDTSTSGGQDDITPVVCKSFTSFANDTIGLKKATTADNGWSMSLLDTDKPIEYTNTSLYHNDMFHKMVKFEEACATKMVVSYRRKNLRYETTIVLNATDRLVTVDGLKPLSTYEFTVSAHYISGDVMSAKPYFVSTLAEGAPEKCRCDWHGTENHTESCTNPSKGKQHCLCKDEYKGRFCEVCQDGFYRDVPSDGCKRCPCDEKKAVETSCRFVEGFLHCDKCAEGYTGNVCHRCAPGYFRMGNKCQPCHCHNNTKPDAPLMCHPSTGACIDCQRNTTGYYCERCLPGYRRVPSDNTGVCLRVTNVNNLSKKKSSDDSSMSPGIIGAIIFVVVLAITVLVGIFVYGRIRKNRERRALWTVEMRPEDDDLDINVVHNEDAHMDDIDDMEFYEKQGRRAKSSGKYSKLTEDC